MEFRSEGFIYGLAAKMFIIAGPIIVFGIASSVLVGLSYYIYYMVA
jgi:stage V sporulation protein AC